jgi:hypothetical protein
MFTFFFSGHVDRRQGHLEDDQSRLLGGDHRSPQAAVHHLGQRARKRLRPEKSFSRSVLPTTDFRLYILVIGKILLFSICLISISLWTIVIKVRLWLILVFKISNEVRFYFNQIFKFKKTSKYCV